jgi:hypothetical protein
MSIRSSNTENPIRIKTRIKAGDRGLNHNPIMLSRGASRVVSTPSPQVGKPIRIKTNIRAGGFSVNHNQVRIQPRA